MDLNDLFAKRILRKIIPDATKASSSLKIAEDKLDRAGRLMAKEFFDESFLSAYTSMFHSARSLLYMDGIQEKGHYAVYVYLSEKYSGKLPRELLEAFGHYQRERHKVLYGFDEGVGEEICKSIIEDSERFLVKIKEVLKNGEL